MALISQSALAAAPAANPFVDVKLHEGGMLFGVLVDTKGAAVVDRPVVLRQGRTTVATTRTDETGHFAVKGIVGGVYQIAASDAFGRVRAWTPQAAPPAAHDGVQIVTGNQVVRGQLEFEGGGVGWVEATAIVLGAAGTTLGIIALTEDEDGS